MQKLLSAFTLILVISTFTFSQSTAIKSGTASYVTLPALPGQQFSRPNFHTLFFESFENAFPPQGWLSISAGNADEEWTLSTSKVHNGSQSAVVRYCSSSETMDEWLITPPINLSGSPRAYLLFYEDQQYWESYGNHHYLKISTTSQTDRASFQTLLDMTPGNHAIDGFKGTPVEIDLTNFVGHDSVYIAFQYTGSDADNWFLDDITVLGPDDHDIRLRSLNLNSHYQSGTVLQPIATVHNAGLNIESFGVSFGYYDWGGNPVIIDNKTVNNLPVGDMQQVAFTDYVINGDFQATFFAQSNLINDMDNSNDVVTRDVDSFTKQKMQVMIEKGTGTWCGYCPGSALAIDLLLKNFGTDIAVIEYHYGDDYETTAGRERINFYGITGYPSAIFNGTNWIIGGTSATGNWINVYNNYVDAYIGGIIETTGFSMSLEAKDRGGYLSAISDITYEALSLIKTYRIFYALTESHIAESWKELDSLQFVFRGLYPDASGKMLYDGATAPTVGLTVIDSVQFTIPDSIVQEHCQLVAFVQDVNSKEIMAFSKVALEPRVPVSRIKPDDELIKPASFTLSQNYPNPFNPETWIQFQLPETGNVALAIYNVKGQIVRKIAANTFKAGQHKIRWDGTDDRGREAASGIYFLTMKYQDRIQQVKMLKLR